MIDRSWSSKNQQVGKNYVAPQLALKTSSSGATSARAFLFITGDACTWRHFTRLLIWWLERGRSVGNIFMDRNFEGWMIVNHGYFASASQMVNFCDVSQILYWLRDRFHDAESIVHLWGVKRKRYSSNLFHLKLRLFHRRFAQESSPISKIATGKMRLWSTSVSGMKSQINVKSGDGRNIA